jgi:hypothetical protein
VEKLVRRFSSFEEAEKADRDYYLSLTPAQRNEILLELLAMGDQADASERRLAPVYRIVKFTRG